MSFFKPEKQNKNNKFILFENPATKEFKKVRINVISWPVFLLSLFIPLGATIYLLVKRRFLISPIPLLLNIASALLLNYLLLRNTPNIAIVWIVLFLFIAADVGLAFFVNSRWAITNFMNSAGWKEVEDKQDEKENPYD